MCSERGPEADTQEGVIADMQVQSRWHMLFKSDQEIPTKALQRELASRQR